MIDFFSLSLPKTILVPILNKAFQYNNKKYKIDSEDGWFKVKIQGNNAWVEKPLYDFQELSKYQIQKGFNYNNILIFQNFDSAKRKWYFNLSKEFYFNNAPTFSPIKTVVWEDRKIYYFEIDYSQYKIIELKDFFENDKDIKELKDITPEMRTAYLFHQLEKERLREIEKEKIEKESIPYRLKQSFSRSGATLINYSISGKRITAIWTLPASNYTYNSVLNADTFMTMEAGYCMSGDDKRHNITSLVLTARNYEEEDLTYITRH